MRGTLAEMDDARMLRDQLATVAKRPDLIDRRQQKLDSEEMDGGRQERRQGLGLTRR